ncbi:MAG TPA: FtsX-like permease family protein [Candidatus Poseidoniales archaeon]|nr:FtsX-like permease family protein [Candidatus Poseidoniales archaeon]
MTSKDSIDSDGSDGSDGSEDAEKQSSSAIPKRTYMDSIADIPANTRTAIVSAWRGKQRGLAIFAGVFLASLVITTVLAYSSGLSQIFFQESLESEAIDAKVEQKAKPGSDSFVNDSVVLIEVCSELQAMKEIADCSLIMGRNAIRQNGFFGNIGFFAAGYLAMESIEGEAVGWENESFDFPEADTGGPPVYTKRMTRLLGPGAYDGELAERFESSMLYGDSWPTHQEAEEGRLAIVPASIANKVGATVGEKLSTLTFSYIIETAVEKNIEECEGGYVETTGAGVHHCRMNIVVENLTIGGIYEDGEFANPTLGYNPIFFTWTILDNSTVTELIDMDHSFFGVAVDRSLLPTTSTSDAEDYLGILSQKVSANDADYSGGVTLFWFDLITGSITFLNIFLGLIQLFDYILMIPIILLSIAVLVYGMVLSLEQRRREISIHRTIGGSAQSMQKMVLREVLVMSFIAWFAGYLLALATVPIVLDAVGFMQFRSGDFEVNVNLGFGSIFFTALSTIGLAWLFGRSRTKDFLAMEIDEGVRKTTAASKSKTWLHILLFVLGIIALIESILEDTSGADDMFDNFFIDGLFGLFGPFFLWIGGALLLAKIATHGPRIFAALFGWSPLLKDIRRGLRSTGSSESIGRLAVIMLLTLSIVTLAAVQGATGTLVDKRTADAQTGSSLSIEFTEAMNFSEVETIIYQALADEGMDNGEYSIAMTSISTTIVIPDGESSTVNVWVLMEGQEEVLLWTAQALPGEDLQLVYDGYQNGGYTAGQSVAFNLQLPGTSGGRATDTDFQPLDTSENVVKTIFEGTLFDISFSDTASERDNGSSESENGELGLPDLISALENYPYGDDLSSRDLSGADLSGLNFSFANLTNTNLNGANLAGTNLSGALFLNTSLMNANLNGANLVESIMLQDLGGPINLLQGSDLSNTDMTSMYGFVNLSLSSQTNATCPSGISYNGTSCQASLNPTPTLLSALSSGGEGGSGFTITETITSVELDYMGQHEWVPGLDSSTAENVIVIGESSYRILQNMSADEEITAPQWFVKVSDKDGKNLADSDADSLKNLRIRLESASGVSEASDLTSSRESVERNGGLIFGTPGLLSLQFVVAAVAAVASAFVFLSLVLTQRKKELAILQAIGASPNQVMRLVLFEILSIVVTSMLLGLILGAGIAQSFNGFFSIFGFIFQIFGGSSTVIERELVWPFVDLLLVSLSVLFAVIVALVATTMSALRSDLASVLKGE